MSREVLALVQRAVWLPEVPAQTSAVLSVLFGERFVGYRFLGASMERPGPAVDLAGISRMCLVGRRLPHQNDYYYDRDWFLDSLRNSRTRTPLALSFSVDGSVTDLLDAKIDFLLTATHLMHTGNHLVEAKLIFLDGRVLSPQLFILPIRPTLSL